MAVDNNSYNKGGLIAFVGSFVFSFALFIVLAFVYKGVELDQIKEKIQADSQAQGFDINTVETPWISTDKLVEHGQGVYRMHCAACHGANGAGDGPGGMALNPKPRNFIEGKWTNGGKSQELFRTISEGLPGTAMVSFGHLSVNDRWSMVHYIRSITENKPQDNESELKAFAESAK